MPKLNRYNDGGFVYGQWREVGRRVDPVTGDIIITERRKGSRDVKYDTRGVSWRKGYEDWLAAGNEGTMEDFKLEAEAWKRSQDRKEFDSQNRERRIKRNQEGEGDDEGKPSDDPRPDDFVGDGPGVGGPGGGGGSGDVSRPDKDDNVSRPRRPGDADTPSVSLLPKRPISPIYDGDYEQVPLVSFVSRDPTNIAIPASQIAMTPEQMGEVILEEGEGVDEVLPDSRVESEYNLRTDSRTNRRGKEIVKQTYTDNINLLRDDGLSTINTKQVDRSKTGRPTRSRGRSVYQEFDSEGNRIFRDVNRFESGGLVSKNNNRIDMYHKKKEMGMGGRNMPKLMKKGGKTSFPDLTGDGKVTFADILRGRLKKGRKKSMDGGGYVETERPGRMSPLPRKGIVFANSEDPVSRETADSIVRFGRGRALDSAIQVPQLVYGRDSQGNLDPDLYSEMSPEEFARLRARGVEIGADIEDFADDLVREGQQQQPMMSEDDPRFVRKVYNSGMGADEPIEFYYYDQDKKLVQNYGGKVKLMKKGGEVEYGLGGAVLAGINAIKNKEGLIGGIKNVAKAYATPGSGFAQGAKLAGGMLANSKNPALAGVGKLAGMAGNFMPGGAGVAGLAGNVMQNMGGGSGMASVMQPLQGLFQQKRGGYVSPKHRLLRG